MKGADDTVLQVVYVILAARLLLPQSVTLVKPRSSRKASRSPNAP